MAARARVAVIGGGVSGSALAIALLEKSGCSVVLVDRAGAFGRGLAYSTVSDRHLLNVRSGRMSLRPDAPGDFVRWLKAHRRPAEPDGFARRADYGAYVAEALAAAERRAPGRLQRLRDEAVGLTAGCDDVEVALAKGGAIRADVVVLALGNQPPGSPGAAGLEALGPAWIADPWAPGALATVGADEDVLLVGTGLTAVDVLLALEERGWRGRATALSRRGLLPRAHAEKAPPVEGLAPSASGLAAKLRAVRAEARARPWREVMEVLRPHGQALWLQADAAERRRFLRHLRPWWDAHRHRMAPEVSAAIERLRAEGRLELAAGRLEAVERTPEGALARWRVRGEHREATAAVARVINCTGPESDPARADSRLLRALLESGAARRDPLGLGLDVDVEGRVRTADGCRQSRLFAMGPLSRGALWEIVAVPEIRVQARALADTLDARFGCPGALHDLFLRHPRDVGESYGEHMGVAFGVGARLLKASAAAFVHGVAPKLCKRTASDTILELHGEITRRRATTDE